MTLPPFAEIWLAGISAEDRIALDREYRRLVRKYYHNRHNPALRPKLTDDEQARYELLSILMTGGQSISIELIERILSLQFSALMFSDSDETEADVDEADPVISIDQIEEARKRYLKAVAYITNPR